jgi:hypothetical protein
MTTPAEKDTPTTSTVVDITIDVDVDKLEKVYRDAVIEFKKDKTNKELRRARTAAKRVWDEAVLKKIHTTDKCAIQLNCKDCSQNFLFTKEEQEYYKDPERNWNHKPLRCRSCAELQKGRRRQSNAIDNENEQKNDDESKGKGRNMCYEFQRKGECKYGNECKFNHDPNFGGKKRKHDDEGDDNDDGNNGDGDVKVLPVDDDNNKEEGDKKGKDDDVPTLVPTCKWGKNCTLKRCRFNHDGDGSSTTCVTVTTNDTTAVAVAADKTTIEDDDDDKITGTSDKKKKKKKHKKRKKAKTED